MIALGFLLLVAVILGVLRLGASEAPPPDYGDYRGDPNGDDSAWK
ncbi:MAG TPA: hypothetical protein VF453_06420 [Burkholderiaceae bacterium]